MIIQGLLLAGLVLAAGFAYRGAPGALSLATRRLGLSALLVAAVLATAFPQVVTWVANRVGVGRGTDLVLYCFVVASIFVCIGLYRRIHEIEHRFVELSRSIALAGQEEGHSQRGEGTLSVTERQRIVP